jgi:hypothetical protein
MSYQVRVVNWIRCGGRTHVRCVRVNPARGSKHDSAIIARRARPNDGSGAEADLERRKRLTVS